MQTIDPADTTWMLVSTALVLMMTPALGFFYAGMVREKNTLNTLMMSFASLGFVGLAWAIAGYSLAFGDESRWLGGARHLLLAGVGLEAHGSIPHLLFMAYQGTFAIVTAALISGAIVERTRQPSRPSRRRRADRERACGAALPSGSHGSEQTERHC